MQLINSFNKAPLPFLGQKRNFLKEFKNALIDNFKDFDGVVLDLFGGSGLLSHHAKEILDKSEVIWNDFDNYQERLDNINNTNILKDQIANITNGYKNDEKITNETRQRILDVLEEKEAKGEYIDFITLSCFILFSGKYGHDLESFRKSAFYNQLYTKNYKKYNADGYLNEVKRVSKDYKELLQEYEDSSKLLILDPPYIYSSNAGYKGEAWSIKDLMELIDLIHKQNFILFGSSVSGFLEFLEFFNKYSSSILNNMQVIKGTRVFQANNAIKQKQINYDFLVVHKV